MTDESPTYLENKHVHRFTLETYNTLIGEPIPAHFIPDLAAGP